MSGSRLVGQGARHSISGRHPRSRELAKPTAAPERLPPALVEQLKPGGRMVLPLGPAEAQALTVLDKAEDGGTQRCELISVRFSQLETLA